LDLNLKYTIFLDVDPILKDLWLSISWDNEKKPLSFAAPKGGEAQDIGFFLLGSTFRKYIQYEH